MNLAIDLKDFDINSVFFQKPITNTVIDNSDFIRILYSNELMILNGIYIKIKLNIFVKSIISKHYFTFILLC